MVAVVFVFLIDVIVVVFLIDVIVVVFLIDVIVVVVVSCWLAGGLRGWA